MIDPKSPGDAAGPILDIRVRWKAGKVALGFAAILALVALFRPLRPGGFPPALKLAVIVALGLGVAGAALLASLKGRGAAEPLALYGFLTLGIDAFGQLAEPLGWPIWPLMVVFLGALAIAETVWIALGVAGLAAGLAGADALSRASPWETALATLLGYFALVLAIDRALRGEKRRLAATLAELARIHHGIDQLDEIAPAILRPTTLKQISEEGRRSRQVDRTEELNETLADLVRVARMATSAHAVLYFEIDRGREVAYLRASSGPDSLVSDCVVPLTSDPFAFVLDRRQAFYATDYKRLLWSLPYYKGEAKLGSLLAEPVRVADQVTGVLVADQVEIQAFTGSQPELMEAFASMISKAILQLQAAQSREELGAEFKAVYPLSRDLATLNDQTRVCHLLLRSAQDLVPFEAAAVVMSDDAQLRYSVEEAQGWAKEFEGREVGLSERTWAAWLVRSAEEPYLLDNVAGQKDHMPILVLDEGAGRAESLLAVPLRVRNKNLGALVLMGRRGDFTASTNRVLGILANQAAAALSTIQLMERIKDLAVRDGLTGLYNRRAFGELLVQAIAREGRHDGRFALLMLDIDHFKNLNDTFGHLAGDAALRNTAKVLERHLRKEDQAARYGGEEFAVILPGSDEAGALHLAERVREAIQKSQLVFEGARMAVTASLGAAVWPAHGLDAETLLAAADRALYAAKQSGRNRVQAAPPLDPHTLL
jgi:diguanylate cyclase (GGDEF)-like protein